MCPVTAEPPVSVESDRKRRIDQQIGGHQPPPPRCASPVASHRRGVEDEPDVDDQCGGYHDHRSGSGVKHPDRRNLCAAGIDQRAGQPPGQRGDSCLGGADADHQPERDHPGQPRRHRPGTRCDIAAVGAKADHGFSTVRSARLAAGALSDSCSNVLLGRAASLEEKWRTPGDEVWPSQVQDW